MSKKNKTFHSPQLNPHPQPTYVPPGMSQAILGTGPQPLVVSETHQTTLTGPIPSPEVIAGYEKVLVGSADRIIKMAEKEQDHRHRFQLRNQTHRATLTFVGQMFAFLIAVFGIGGGIYLVKNDKSVAGFGVFFTSLASIVGLFFYNRNQPKTPPIGKQEQVKS